MAAKQAYRVPLPEFKSEVEGLPPCYITGIICPVCGQYGSIGPWYTTIECSTVFDLGDEVKKYINRLPIRGKSRPMSPDEFNILASKLMPIMAKDQPIVHGTKFGPMVGLTKGPIGDFAWHSSWTPLVRESIFEEIRDAGFPVIGAPAQLKFRKDPGERLIQLELRPTARLASSYTECEVCGAIDVDTPVVIDASSYDESIPFQVVYECPNVAVVSAPFAEYARERNFTDFTLIPIDMA